MVKFLIKKLRSDIISIGRQNFERNYKDFFNEVFSTVDYVPLFAKYYLKLYDYRLNNCYIC